MPKVTRQETKAAAAGPLREVAMDTGIEAGVEGEEQQAPGKLPSKPAFKPLSPQDAAAAASPSGNGARVEFRRVPVPQHRLTPLRNAWMDLYTPITQHLKLDMRMNLRTKRVEIKTTKQTPSADLLQRAADFVHAFVLGFESRDAVALLRLDDLYVETFEVKDVKTLRGEHLSRAIGRLAGKSGKTRFTIENATRTRIVVADTRIHILGAFANIRVARDAICSLILGSPPGKVYSKLRTVCARLNQA
jgi:RNA-binding protein PNO1